MGSWGCVGCVGVRHHLPPVQGSEGTNAVRDRAEGRSWTAPTGVPVSVGRAGGGSSTCCRMRIQGTSQIRAFLCPSVPVVQLPFPRPIPPRPPRSPSSCSVQAKPSESAFSLPCSIPESLHSPRSTSPGLAFSCRTSA